MVSCCEKSIINNVKTSKFKTISISAVLRMPLERKFVTFNALLPYVLKNGCKKYDTLKKINMKAYEMFGAVFGLIRVYVLLFFVMIIYDEFNKFSVVKESVICSSINADVQKRLNKKVATNIKKIKENVSK